MAYKQKFNKKYVGTIKPQYFEVIITSQGRRSMKDSPETFDQQRKVFGSKAEVDAFLKENYGKIKSKQKMFVDTKAGKTKQVGYIFNFWNEDISHPYTDEGKKNKWYQSDWVEIRQAGYTHPKF